MAIIGCVWMVPHQQLCYVILAMISTSANRPLQIALCKSPSANRPLQIALCKSPSANRPRLRVNAALSLVHTKAGAHLRDYGPIRPQSGGSDGFMASFVRSSMFNIWACIAWSLCPDWSACAWTAMWLVVRIAPRGGVIRCAYVRFKIEPWLPLAQLAYA